LGAQHGKLDKDLRTSALLGTPSDHAVHDCYPFAPEDGVRFAPMLAGEFVDRMAVLVAIHRFLGMGVDDSRLLRYDIYVRMHHFGRRSTSLFLLDIFRGGFAAKIHVTSFYFAFWVPHFAMFCMRAVFKLVYLEWG
jgi:hypothetical protein